ncbi:MAG TPA: TRAM domain-containing protein [Gemmatimonadaceae bacterium]|nr:TRAM domain-containing protein [Gemmatimonadaceae bacterium]
MAVVSVAIDSIAAGGDGVGRTNGLVVFVPRTAPGDVVTAQISGKGHFARGALRSIVTPSPVRMEPPCPHYTRDKCGGCQLQHMTYDSQLVAKQIIVRDSLQRIGKRGVDAPAIEQSPKEWRYRTKLTLAMRRRGARWIAGLHPYDDPVRVFALADCPITDRRVVAAWHEVMQADAYFPDASELRGSIRITSGGPTLVMMGGQSWAARDQFTAAVPSISAVWWEPAEDKPRRLLYDRRRDRSPSASFEQVNAEMAEILRTYVLDRAKSYEPASVVDAYAGGGDTALAFSKAGVSVTAIELDPDASEWSAAKLAGSSSRAIHGRVEDELPGALPADLVILNPPRAGVDVRVTETLEAEAARLRGLIYISCNPATLARDLARLPSFQIESLRAFDMFPQTAHVETVCELRPTGAVA